MSTLLEHADQIREEFADAYADKKLSFGEVFQIAGVIVGAVACTMQKLEDPTKLGQLVDEAEDLYMNLLDPAKIDIPKVPEFAERYVIDLGKSFIRPAIEKLADALN